MKIVTEVTTTEPVLNIAISIPQSQADALRNALMAGFTWSDWPEAEGNISKLTRALGATS